MTHLRLKYETFLQFKREIIQLRILGLVFINPSIPIGKGFMIGHCFDIIVDAERIGDNVKIMQQVTIGRSIGGNKSGIPVIGNNVFIGAGAKIIGNVKVGNNVIIGANSVVTKDIPDNAIVGGCPARVLSMNGEYEVNNWVKDLTVER